MARRRLTPLPDAAAAQAGAPAPPIARVAGSEAMAAALREVSDALAGARAEGRLALALPLAQIEDGWLMRDRLAPEGEEFAALLDSLRAHGQRMPIEVTELGPERYGLISGWRRLTALRQLHRETADPRFATVLAVLRRPEGAEAAYVAMVEENEIRAGLSHYERARIVARAAEAGVFADDRAALRGLFGAASRARRSKIGAFLGIYRALDGALRFPAALPERLGLSLAQALAADPALARVLRAQLAAAAPASPEAELALLAQLLAQGGRAPAPPVAAPPPSVHGPGPSAGHATEPAGAAAADVPLHSVPAAPDPPIRLSGRPGRMVLSGEGVDAAFIARLRAWLDRQGG